MGKQKKRESKQVIKIDATPEEIRRRLFLADEVKRQEKEAKNPKEGSSPGPVCYDR